MSEESKIYVGNLPYNANEDGLREFFNQYGTIEDIKLIVDFQTGRSKGFGFITFSTTDECERAVEGANDADMGGRKLKVNMARESERRGGGAGGGAGRSNFRGNAGNGGNSGNGNYRPRRDTEDGNY